MGNAPAQNRGFIMQQNAYEITLKQQENAAFNLYNAGNKGMTIAATGNIGIGIQAPTTNFQLHNSTSNSANLFSMTNNATGTTSTDGFRIQQQANGEITLKQQENAAFNLYGSQNKGMTILPNGYVGFNTDYPQQQIHVVDENILISKSSSPGSKAPGSPNGSILFGANVTANYNPYGEWGIEYLDEPSIGSGLNFWKVWSPSSPLINAVLFLKNNGNVGIGVGNPQSKLAVDGTICAKEVRVALSGSPCWPDFVFNKDYNLMSLDELEQFIYENKHLPNTPSAAEVEENGIQLGEMNALLLQKIEELTIHLIDLQKRLSELEDKKGGE
jgi:hypothetical protein